RTLREVDLIAAEDTRRTSKLLAHYEIRKPLVSVREHNEVREAPKIIGRLSAGQSVALVTDAGTPGIADPGSRLVAAVRQAGHKVVPIPGPSAVAAALSVSGVTSDSFCFRGFPPRSGKDREGWFHDVAADPRTQVFFEAPHRIRRTLGEMTQLVTRPIFIHREISKINEELVVWPNIPVELGEFVVVLPPVEPSESSADIDPELVFSRYQALTALAGFDDTLAFEMLGKFHGVEPAVIRKSVKKSKILVKRQTE
ncbi:MAG TPA: ribosomal RNA small subunit methyltransferase I, partial [Vicinamibacterales bacterium]|nr:ribosomal RNA small subunit methyltransferase I [Vicinamibacterales bacterium]